VAFISYSDIFRSHKIVPPRRKIKHSDTTVWDKSFLRKGDFVVHVDHGIGMFKDITKLEENGVTRDYLQLEYKDKDILYVPVEHVHLVSRYVGLSQGNPSLHKLGGKGWSSDKKDAVKKIKDMAQDLLQIQAKRSLFEGIAYSADTNWQREFEESFLFDETPDQEKVIDEIKRDMERSKPMDRLLCGDVGFGKTEVAIRAAFKAVMDGKQVAVLVPTTILASQHFHTFTNRMAGYPIEIGVLSRFKTKKEQRETMEHIKEGKVDIVIGTHRLLQGDLYFKDLGLLVIDEEQKFGVAHKEKIKKLRSLVDVLTMTATPLPRTLYMSMTGLRDVSSLNTPPEDRLPIKTKIMAFDPETVKQAVARELARGGQIFFLHNRVKSIYKKAEDLRELLPNVRISVGHGQMHEHELEDVINDFVEQKFDMLVSTTIIESGVDMPSVNTIFVDNADMFGLADLYQLRGRVGRSSHRAYAYFLVDPSRLITPEAQARLGAIHEFSALGSGYQLALRDLEIRGGGNILGREQHGSIVKVGFDMYCVLLKRSTQELQGKTPDPLPAVIDLQLDLTIEESYIPDMQERLSMYRKLGEVSSLVQVDDLAAEFIDRFGKGMPGHVQLLLQLSKLKINAGNKGVFAILRKGNFVTVVGAEGHDEKRIPDGCYDAKPLMEWIGQVL